LLKTVKYRDKLEILHRVEEVVVVAIKQIKSHVETRVKVSHRKTLTFVV